MKTTKKFSNRGISNVCTTVIKGALVTSILVCGNKAMIMGESSDGAEQVVFSDDEKSNIYNVFTDGSCITLDVPGYSDNRNTDSGVEIVMINEEKIETLKKIEEIAALEDNWNDNGAKAFSVDLITKVRNIITFLDIQPEVFPTACESLQLEYDRVDGAHMEIEVTENEQAEIFVVDETGREEFRNVSANARTINKVVTEFYG